MKELEAKKTSQRIPETMTQIFTSTKSNKVVHKKTEEIGEEAQCNLSTLEG